MAVDTRAGTDALGGDVERVSFFDGRCLEQFLVSHGHFVLLLHAFGFGCPDGSEARVIFPFGLGNEADLEQLQVLGDRVSFQWPAVCGLFLRRLDVEVFGL